MKQHESIIGLSCFLEFLLLTFPAKGYKAFSCMEFSGADVFWRIQ